MLGNDESSERIDPAERFLRLACLDYTADDPGRGERLSLEAGDIYFDYSKNRVTDETLRLLVALAEESSLPGRIDWPEIQQQNLCDKPGSIACALSIASLRLRRRP